ncbi:MAG: peptidase [Gammaproteobacteria bacterium]|nr:MAG: peptidase [Gammaproteobacteria bacterium]RKZ96730.1 MAG: peptidase [Gammaproteobacteria bacterium]
MFRFLKYISTLILITLILVLVSAVSIYYILAPQLPEAVSLKETQLQVPLRIFSSEGLLLAEFGEKRRIPVEYTDVPKLMTQAILASEDDRFFEHPGVDYHGLLRAAYSLAVTGHKTQGGSTITMQVARNFFLSNEKTYLRKLNEIILAFQIEHALTKEEILTLYLNKIYLGKRAYGVGAAANVYYGKQLQDLTLAEFAMIAGLPKAPSKFNPMANPERALLRRNYVLRRMWEVGYISEQDYLTATLEPITAQHHSREVEVYAPFVAEMVRNQLIDQYGDDTYNSGFNVYTTIRANHQTSANIALQSALFSYDRRHGYRGALSQITILENDDEAQLQLALEKLEEIGPLLPAVVVTTTTDTATIYIKNIGTHKLTLDSIKWAQPQLSTDSKGKKPNQVNDVLNRGNVIHVSQDKQGIWQLAQLPEAEGALIAVSPYDGAVTALNGGFDYFHNKFNRVIQSRRQPGSGFKPFIYSAALEKGYTAASIINDAPVVFDDPGLENVWRPENYSGKFFGPTRLRVALTHSRNLVSIRLLRDIGAQYAIDYAKRFGFDTSQMHPNLSLALGSGSASPWDMARAYSSLANGGYRIEPYIIQRIEDVNGAIIMQAQPDTVCETCLDSETSSTDEIAQYGFSPAKRIMTPQNTYIMNSLLRDVVRYGTGRKAMSLERNDLAGKTGTTNDQVDAWFNGFQPELVAISWVGFDTPRTLGRYETGGRAALPMWIDFMRVALKDIPQEPLKQPVDMATVRIDPKTGLLARPETVNAIYESFRQQYVPTQLTPVLTGHRTDEFDSNPDTIIDPF